MSFTLKKMFDRMVCRDVGEGGSTGIGDEQLSMMEDLLGDRPTGEEETGSVDTTPSTEDPQETKEQTKEAETQVDEPTGVVENEPGQEVETKDQVNETDQTIQALREQILALTEAMGVDPKLQSVKEDVKTEEAKSVETAKEIVQAFLTEDELDRLIDEPNLINVALQRNQQAILGSLQGMVEATVNAQILMNKAVTDFYTTNSDLLPYAKFVQFVMRDVESKNRDKTYGEIFETTATECRKRLGLAQTPARTRDSAQQSQQQKPAFAGSKRGNNRPEGKQEIFDSNAADLMDFNPN